MIVKVIMPEIPAPVRAYLDAFDPDDMRELNADIASEEGVLFAAHIEEAARSRHKWSNLLGAAPTGALKRAKNIKTGADEDGASVEVTAPGIRRVFDALDIKPRVAAYLTIPANAVSYGKRVAHVKAEGWSVFRPVAKGGKKSYGPFRQFLAGTRGDDFRILFWLKESVTVPQDREILPSDDKISAAAKKAMESHLKAKSKSEGLR